MNYHPNCGHNLGSLETYLKGHLVGGAAGIVCDEKCPIVKAKRSGFGDGLIPTSLFGLNPFERKEIRNILKKFSDIDRIKVNNHLVMISQRTRVEVAKSIVEQFEAGRGIIFKTVNIDYEAL